MSFIDLRANGSVGDSKTLAIHPWSTTHEQLSDQEKLESGTTEDMIRISVGTEHIDDIIGDFEQSFAASKAAGTKKGANGHGIKEDVTDGPAGIAGAT